MKPVRFIQYLRPDGRKKYVEVDLDDEVADKASEIWNKGFILAIEELSDGDIHMSIEGQNRDYGNRICQNGPDVLTAASEMIIGFALDLHEADEEVE